MKFLFSLLGSTNIQTPQSVSKTWLVVSSAYHGATTAGRGACIALSNLEAKKLKKKQKHWWCPAGALLIFMMSFQYIIIIFYSYAIHSFVMFFHCFGFSFHLASVTSDGHSIHKRGKYDLSPINIRVNIRTWNMYRVHLYDKTRHHVSHVIINYMTTHRFPLSVYRNLSSPASGDPVIGPTQDMVLGPGLRV